MVIYCKSICVSKWEDTNVAYYVPGYPYSLHSKCLFLCICIFSTCLKLAHASYFGSNRFAPVFLFFAFREWQDLLGGITKGLERFWLSMPLLLPLCPASWPGISRQAFVGVPILPRKIRCVQFHGENYNYNFHKENYIFSNKMRYT